ncbi:ABC transporter ATP-binding protein [Paenibacillus sp. MWE-103]|uniref:ABC transporter ATP-binding protein n=1 Tax=Paenibacillus artemisiicola TaxID=1172618 RepID=A0ABS3WFW1_9BACL|nr:ABC transporter ATP-binding protein [Paenibacillus artemisiicola]MBO7747148.1 ABC transporter ATP-binding protein [Paenibacillus artemisiicola]
MRIELRHVSKRYDAEAPSVNDLSLSVRDGELITILGPSGCGKSTTLLMIAGILPPSQGDILFDGHRVNGVLPKDRRIGMVFQNSALYPNMNVRKNIEYPLKNMGVPRKERAQRAEEAARMVQMSDYMRRKPGQLSGGQRQRIAIARAVVKRPGLLLLDEPLSSLDANLRGSMREEIRRLQKELGITTIMVTHDQEEALSMSDKIAVMNAGELQQIGTPLQLYGAPANWFVASFLGMPAMNELACAWRAGSLQLTAAGQAIPLPGAAAQELGAIREGQAMRLAFRPHQASLVTDPVHRLETDLRGRVAAVEFTGRERLVHVRIGDATVKAYAGMAESLDEHQEVAVRLAADYYVFDRESGANLRLPAASGRTEISETGDMTFAKQAAYSR